MNPPRLCPICKFFTIYEGVDPTEHILLSSEIAAKHGYAIIGHRFRPLSAIEIIPRELQRDDPEGRVYAPEHLAVLLGFLQDLWPRETPRSVRVENRPLLRAWIERIGLDEEAYGIFDLIFESVNDEHEAASRVADLFDLPKFWERP